MCDRCKPWFMQSDEVLHQFYFELLNLPRGKKYMFSAAPAYAAEASFVTEEGWPAWMLSAGDSHSVTILY